MNQVKLSAFNDYLTQQIGQPYLWGGQHTKLTPENYVSVVTRKESDPNNRAAAIAYCKKLFDAGATVLYAYDCSGLGMYYLQNVTGVFGHDLSANGMMGQCEAATEPKCGYWVFRLSGDRATHIGYMVSDTEVIHAKGRAYGVVREAYKPSYWHRIGKPKCIEFDEPQPEPEPVHYEKYILTKGSVRVRTGNGTDFAPIHPTPKNAYLPYLGQAEEYPHWYKTRWQGQDGYITNNPKYVEIVEK